MKMNLLIPLQMMEKPELFQILCLENGVKKILQLISSNSTEKQNSKTPISIDLKPHQLFKLFFENEVITYLFEQSKIYAASKGNFVFHVTLDKFHAFLASLLISGYTSLPWRGMYWQQEPNVFN